jgi:hypothetical protein
MIVALAIALTHCALYSFAQCPNDICINAIEIDCTPTAFDNYDCTVYDFQLSGMSRLVGNCNNSNMSNCGGVDYTSIHTDLWFGFYLDSPSFYDINVATNYSCTVCSLSGSKGVSVFIWRTDSGCEDAYIVFAKHCPNAACWSGDVGQVYGAQGEYGQQNHYLTVEFLSSGQYYVQVQAWGWGPNHPNFWDYSKGSGTISICPTTPLSTKPNLRNEGKTLHWTGLTETDWTIFELGEDLVWNEIGRTDEKQFEIHRTGYYIVAGSTGFSNIVNIELQNINAPILYNEIGQEGVKTGIKK